MGNTPLSRKPDDLPVSPNLICINVANQVVIEDNIAKDLRKLLLLDNRVTISNHQI